MKKNKRILAVVCVMTLLCLSIFPASAAQESPYEFLLRCGYSEEVLNTLPEDILLKIYNEIGDNEVIDVKEEVYYLDEGGVLSAVNPLGTIESSSLKITIGTGVINKKGTDQITGCLYSALWEWADNKPLIRIKDAVTVNWDASIFRLSSFYAQDLGKNSQSEEFTIIKDYGDLSESNQGGLGHFTQLSSSYSYVGGGMLVLLAPNAPMYNGDNYGTAINFNYVHNRNPLGLGLSFSLDGFGVSANAGLLSDSRGVPASFKFRR